MGVCYIIGAGEMTEKLPVPQDGDLVIACDGGFRYCQENALKVDMIVGDFDSLGFLPEHEHVIRLNPIKDETDTAWAIGEGIKRGYKDFVIYGGTGGRLSHTIANIQLLADMAALGCKGVLIAKNARYLVIHNDKICFDALQKGYLSVFCLGDRAEGVYEEGLKYSLQDAVLTKENPVGVSNEFIGVESRVTVKNGTLLIICERKEEAGEM